MILLWPAQHAFQLLCVFTNLFLHGMHKVTHISHLHILCSACPLTVLPCVDVCGHHTRCKLSCWQLHRILLHRGDVQLTCTLTQHLTVLGALADPQIARHHRHQQMVWTCHTRSTWRCTPAQAGNAERSRSARCAPPVHLASIYTDLDFNVHLERTYPPCQHSSTCPCLGRRRGCCCCYLLLQKRLESSQLH